MTTVDILSIALSGINASRNRTATAANNLANVNTQGFQAQRVNTSTGPNGVGAKTDSVSFSTLEGTPTGSNVNIADELINLRLEDNAVQANVSVAQTGDALTKTAIDLLA